MSLFIEQHYQLWVNWRGRNRGVMPSHILIDRKKFQKGISELDRIELMRVFSPDLKEMWGMRVILIDGDQILDSKILTELK